MNVVRLNGQERRISPGWTVADLLDDLGLNRDGVAVAVNRRVVPRSEHPTSRIPDGAGHFNNTRLDLCPLRSSAASLPSAASEPRPEPSPLGTSYSRPSSPSPRR